MAYDRFDRDERSRWSEDRNDDRFGRNWRGDNRSQDFRGRARPYVFSTALPAAAAAAALTALTIVRDEAERRRRQDDRHDERFGDTDRSRTTATRDYGRDYDRGYGRDFDRDRDRTFFGGGRTDRDFNEDRGVFNRGGSTERDYNLRWRRELGTSDRDFGNRSRLSADDRRLWPGRS